jgi:hypothetical protein
MLYEPSLAHQIAKERMKDTLREAKQIQLGRIAERPRKSQNWRLPIASVFRSLLALFAQRKVGY